MIQILVAWSIISSLALHGAIDLLHDFYSYSTGSTGSKKCCSREQRFYYKQGFHCSQLNRNKKHVINLLLHEELSWRLFTKLPESISTFYLSQKMWSQGSVPWGCTKMCLEQEIVPVALFRCLKIRSLTFAFIFDHENMTLESFCTSKAQIRI